MTMMILISTLIMASIIVNPDSVVLMIRAVTMLNTNIVIILASATVQARNMWLASNPKA